MYSYTLVLFLHCERHRERNGQTSNAYPVIFCALTASLLVRYVNIQDFLAKSLKFRNLAQDLELDFDPIDLVDFRTTGVWLRSMSACGVSPRISQSSQSKVVWMRNQSGIYDLGRVGRYQQTLNGSLSAVSKPIFASKYSLESIFRDLQVVHTFAPLRSQNFSKKVAIF